MNQQIYYNDSHKDVPSGNDYYVLTGLKANSIYNISVAAITGEDSEIIGDHISIIARTSLGGELGQRLLSSRVDVMRESLVKGQKVYWLP